MIKVKDGYGKLIGSEYKGSADLVLLSDGSNLGYAIPSTGNTLVLRNTSGQIESSLTTDSNLSPFVVTSTVVNTNLNSDLLDGFHAGGLFLTLSSSTSVNLTVKIGNTEKKIEKLYATYDGLGNNIAAKYVTLDTALTVSGVKTFSSLLKFTVSSVSPFTVDSNIVVTNLNADLLDGTHKADLFTDFSNITSGTDANKVSITIGGTTKKIIINYAQNAGSIGGITADGLFTDLSSTPAKNLSITIGGTTKDIISLYSNYWVPQAIGSKDFNTMYGDTYRGTSWYGGGSNTATNNPLGSGLAFGMLVWRNADGHTALLIMGSDGRLYVRVYDGSSWSQLLKFAYATDAGLGGGYWANLPVLAIADSTTTPTFGGVTVNGTSLLNGLVGIGILNPKAKLAVNISALSANPTSGSLGTLNTMSVGAAGSYGTYFWTRGTGKGYIQVGREDGTATTYDLILQLLGGNVGIGTEDPTAKLDVLGYTKITASAGSSPSSTPLIVTGTGSNTGQRLIQAFSPNLPMGTTGAYGAHLLLGVSDTSYNFGYMKFVYAGAGSTDNALRFGFHNSDNLVSLLANGNMGVGTTTPIHKLDVSGSTRSNWHVFNKWGGQVGHASSAAWYNVYEGRIYTWGDNILLNLSHSYYYTSTDSVTFQINVGYHNASITLLNSTSGSAIFLKIRVRFVNNEYVYIDVLIYSHTANTDGIYVSGLGTGTFKVPTATSDTTGTVKEVSVFYNGFYTPAAKIDTLYGLIVQEISNIWLNPARLQIGRPNSTVYSDRGCIGITDGNLHLDAYKNKAIYLNWYQAPGTTEGQVGTSVVITAAGNMGIGTAGPIHKLQVMGAGVFNNTNSTTYASNGITIGAGDAAERYITCYGKTGTSYINVGYGPGVNNSGEFFFNYVSNGSTSNYSGVGIYGGANYMYLYPDYTTFRKPLVMPGELYSGNCAINMSNSDIININALYTADNAEDGGEGLQFSRGNGYYDSIWASGGVLYFSPNGNLNRIGSYSTNYTVLHTGNYTSNTAESKYWTAKFNLNTWSRILSISDYASVLVTIGLGGTNEATVHTYLVSTGWNCARIVLIGNNGFSSYYNIQVRITRTSTTLYYLEVYHTYNYNGNPDDATCRFTKLSEWGAVTPITTITTGGGTVCSSLTSSATVAMNFYVERSLYTDRLNGFSEGGTQSLIWGNQTGTGIHYENDSTGGSFEFRRDNPSSGKVSLKLDGRVYVSEGNYPVLSSTFDGNGYPAILTPDGASSWIRVTNSSSYGLLPYTSGSAGNGHNYIGTSSWYFYEAYIDHIYGRLHGAADSASSSGYIWGNYISNLNTPTTWSSDGTRLVYDTYSGSASNKPVSVDNANGLVTFFKSKHGVANLYVSQLAFPDHSRFYFRYAANGSWGSWYTVAFTSDIPNPANYYWANIRVSASSSTGTLPTFNTCYTSNWFRSTGATGWYNESYTGGIYMEDTTWVRIYNNKKFYVSNSDYSAIHSAGGVYVAGAVHSYANLLKSTCNGCTISIGSQNNGWCHYDTSAPAHWFNKAIHVAGHVYGGSGYNRRLAYVDEIPGNTWRGIENVLTSTSTSNSLTANMGRVLANGGSDRPIVLLAGTLYRSGASSSYTTWAFTGYKHRSISSTNPSVYISGGVARFYFTNASGYGFSFAQVCANHQASGEATGYQSGEYQTRSSGLFWFGTYAYGLYLYIRAIALGDRNNDTAESYTGMWKNYSDGVTRVSIIAVGYAW